MTTTQAITTANTLSVFQEAGIYSTNQQQMLLRLYGGKQLNMGELARQINKVNPEGTQAALVGARDALVEKGFIASSREDRRLKDRRFVYVVITAKGSRLVEAALS